jgi:hypothetical protein
MIDYREYENGVTDVLRFIAGSGVKVERDVLVRRQALRSPTVPPKSP